MKKIGNVGRDRYYAKKVCNEYHLVLVGEIFREAMCFADFGETVRWIVARVEFSSLTPAAVRALNEEVL